MRRKACPEQRWTFKANLSTHYILHNLMIGRNGNPEARYAYFIPSKESPRPAIRVYHFMIFHDISIYFAHLKTLRHESPLLHPDPVWVHLRCIGAQHGRSRSPRAPAIPQCPEKRSAGFGKRWKRCAQAVLKNTRQTYEILSWKYVQSGVSNIKLVSFCFCAGSCQGCSFGRR